MSDKRARWDRALIQRNYSTRKFFVELDEQQRAAIASVVTRQMVWGTRWDNATSNYIKTFASELNYALYNEKTCETGGSGGGGNYIESEKNEDDMCKLSIEKTGGNTYLVEDCGCGQINRYVLTEVETDYGGEPGGGSVAWPTNAVSGITQSLQGCYAGKAANILNEAFKEYASRIWDILKLGLEAADVEVVVDGVGEIVDIVKNENNYESFRGLAKEAILNAIDTYKPLLQQNFELEGPLDRRELKRLTFKVYPQLEGAIPLAFLADKWAFTANLRRINAQLAVAATECQTGNQLTQSLYPTEIVEVSGNEYRVYELTDVDLSGPWEFDITLKNFQAIGWQANGAAPGDASRQVNFGGVDLGDTNNGRFSSSRYIARYSNAGRDAIYAVNPNFDSVNTYSNTLSTPPSGPAKLKLTGSEASNPVSLLYVVERVI